MKKAEQIRNSFSGFKHQKIATVIENEILVYTSKEVDCMIEIAQKQAYKYALTNLVSECVKLGTHYEIVQITDICHKLNESVSDCD